MVQNPSPGAPTQYQREIYGQFRPPALSTKFSVWESQARAKLPPGPFGYVHDAAGTGATNAANTSAFDRYRLRPRMLVDATVRDISVELFGRTYASPILAAPVGVQNIVHPDGEEATARACEKVGVPMVLSTAATRTIEQVAAANGSGDRWFQLYWPRADCEDITASLLNRAKENGYTTLVVTLDTFNIAWRPTDLDAAYLPFLWAQGVQIGFSDPAFNERYRRELSEDKRGAWEKLKELYDLLKRPKSVSTAAALLWRLGDVRKSQSWLHVTNSGTYRSWPDLEVLKKLWDGPIVLKGVQTVEDAHRALDYGMSGIVVSNHGGRQLDGAVASLDALEAITRDERIRGSNLTILFDSGIRTGVDVVKALALGAKAVMVARPYMYGLALDGQAGVEHVLRCMLAEMDNALANAGKTSIRELSRKDLEIRESARL